MSMTSMTFGDFDFLEIIILYLYQKLLFTTRVPPLSFQSHKKF